jgi:hypothetical protein
MNSLYEPDTRPAVEAARQELLRLHTEADRAPEGDRATAADRAAGAAWEEYYELFHSEPEPAGADPEAGQ